MMGAQISITAVPRRYEALAFIIERIVQTRNSPAHREIATHLGVKKTRVTQLLAQLEREGLIELTPSAHRNIVVRDLARCRQIIDQMLGQQGWRVALPLGELMPPCPIEQLSILPLIVKGPVTN